MSSTSSSRMSSKVKKILKRIGIGLAVTVIVLVVAVEVLLQTGALTGLVRKIASGYVDGELKVERVTGSIITHFPKVRLVLEDVSITYPHEKFSYARDITPELRFTDEGRAAKADTLLSFHNLDATASWLDAIGGKITVNRLLLDRPRFFMHDYGNGVTNLDVFGGGGETAPEEPAAEPEPAGEDAGTPTPEVKSLLPLTVGELVISGHPHVVYTAAADDIYFSGDFEDLQAVSDDEGMLALLITGDADLRTVGYELRRARLEARGTTFHRYDFGCDAIPEFDLTFRMPRSGVWHQGMAREGMARFVVRAGKVAPAGMNVEVDSLRLRADGLRADLVAGMDDVFGADPLMRARGKVDARVDSVGFLLPEDMDADGTGTLALWLDGESRLSKLDAIHYPEAKVEGNLTIRDLRFQDRTDDMQVFLPQADVDIRTMENRFDTSIPQGTQVLGLKADIDTVHFRYGGEMEAHGKSLMLAAQNSVLSYGANGPMGSFTPFMVFVKAGRFDYKDGDDLLVGMRETRNSLRVSSDSVDRQLPRFTLSSVSGDIFLREGVSRYMLRNTDLKASAKLNVYERQRRRAHRDSLRRRMTDRPEWLTTEEFKSSDISVELDEDVKGYLRDWDLDGHAFIGGGSVVTPYFRTRTVLDTLATEFTLDEVKLHDGRVHAGESQLALNGTVKNLRNAIMGRGPYKLDFELSSELLNIDSLLFAAAAGQEYDVEALRDNMEVVTVDDDAYEALVVADTLIQDLPRIDLFVVPANIHADVVLYANNVKYGDIEVNNLSADAHVKQRIIQVTNVAGTSNLGNFFLDAFYGTQSMQDIGAGADFTMYGMDAAVLTETFPEICASTEGYVDSLSGDLEAQFAGVTRFDPQLNTDLATTNGVVRVTGGYGNATEGSRHKLVIHNGPELRSIAFWLPFINRNKIPITTLEANALIEEGQLEILPMLIRNDWYTVSIAGVQNVDPDEAFKYMVSIVHSPLLVPFGINLVGENFDDFDFDLVKSKYRRTREIPRLDSRQKVQDAVDRLSVAVYDVYRLGIGGVIAAANPSRSFIELKQEGNYEFALLVDELDETDEAGLRAMQDGVEEISADDYATRELTRLRKETMDPKKEEDE